MFNLILIILVSLIPLVVTWITSPEEIFISNDKPEPKQIFQKKVNKKLSTKGKWFIIAILLTAAFAFFQFSQNEKDKFDLKREREKSELKISDRVDSSRKVLFKDLSDALAKQNLQFDSAQKRIEKLVKDSSKKVVNNIQQEPSPHVSLCLGDSAIKLTYQKSTISAFKISFCGYNSTSKNVKCTAYVVGAKAGQYLLLKKQVLLSNNTFLAIEGMDSDLFVGNTDGINIFFFYVEFEFKDLNGKEYTHREIGQYIMSTGKYGLANSEFRDQILKFLKK